MRVSSADSHIRGGAGHREHAERKAARQQERAERPVARGRPDAEHQENATVDGRALGIAQTAAPPPRAATTRQGLVLGGFLGPQGRDAAQTTQPDLRPQRLFASIHRARPYAIFVIDQGVLHPADP
jgi:hypothetical protein